MSHREKLWRNRLAAWEDELRTDRHGMAYLAWIDSKLVGQGEKP